MKLKNKLFGLLKNLKTYWNVPMEGRHMTFKEIASYSGGGIGAYMIITIGSACILSMGNTLISSTLGVDPNDMYIMYVVAVIVNVFLTGIRANIIDNTRNKAGKYRPYIVSMAIPTAIISVAMVWFPYKSLDTIFPAGELFGESYSYIAKCGLIMLFNLLLHFFYYFFYDGYENLIHVLSPNTQERADVASVKSVVYSLAPTIVNLLTPIIAQNVFHTNTTDIRVYRLIYPILAVGGILLCMVVYKNTEEKIVQARTHVQKIRFMDALREVAKNKYFWIISLAGWIGFLESAFLNIMNWLYNYGGACSGNAYGIITTVYGNASLWGMLLAPFCIRKWGKKAVLVVTNMFNVVFILIMLPITSELNGATIWLVLCCMYLNAFMGSFAHILNPAIQADIRDYQQYKTGERIDGMFSAVGTIGTVITLATSAVLPAIYERGGITKENAKIVTSDPEILNRVLGDGKTVGTVLQEQLANGQNNYENAYSALYDPDILMSLLHVLIIFSVFGAIMNIVPYFWYDFNEKKQKSVIRVLKVRAMFEDYGNGILKNEDLVETVELIENARLMAEESPKSASRSSYRNVSDKAGKKDAKKAYREALKFNEEIEISKFVCAELDKFSNPAYNKLIEEWKDVYSKGIKALTKMDYDAICLELREAKAMPKSNADEKEIRSQAIDFARNKKYAYKAIQKFYPDGKNFYKPNYSVIESMYEQEDKIDLKIKDCYQKLSDAKKNKKKADTEKYKAKINNLKAEKKNIKAKAKAESDRLSNFSVAAKPYLVAEKNVVQMKNYSDLGEIMKMYEITKAKMVQA
ncbi:MAG: MFS transporter [Ruminococcaceae bacterium]|nr:MFS transporter [Oscillospiraceae bacterium]